MTSLTNLKPFSLRTSAPIPSKWTLHFSSAERISTVYVLRISRASPKASNPGPRLAVLAGTLTVTPVSYTHLRAHETRHDIVCRLLLEKKKKNNKNKETDKAQEIQKRKKNKKNKEQ